MRIPSLFPLALVSGLSEAEAIESQPVDQHAELVRCIRDNTEDVEIRTMRVMGASTKDMQDYTWVLQEKEGKEYLAVHARMIEVPLQTFGIWEEMNMILLDNGNDGSLDAVSRDGFSSPVDPWEPIWQVVQTNSLISCQANMVETQPDTICPGAWTTSREEQLELHDKIAPSVVGFVSDSGQLYCSGAMVENNRILTAGHCVDDRKEALLTWPVEGSNGRQVYLAKAAVLKTSSELDLGLLQLPRKAKTQEFQFATEEGSPLDFLQTVGHPNGRGWIMMTLLSPVPFDMTEKEMGGKAYLPSKPLCWNHGLSGAPLLNSKFEITGVVHSQTDDMVVQMAGSVTREAVLSFMDGEMPHSTVRGPIQICDLLFGEEGILTGNGKIRRTQVDIASCK